MSCTLVKVEMVHTNFEMEKKDLPMDLFYSGVGAVLSIVGQIFLNISLKYEDATKIAIVKTIDVFFSFTLQYLLLNIKVDLFSLIGAVSIISGTFVILLFKLFELKYEMYKKSQKAKELKTPGGDCVEIKKENKKSFKNSILRVIFVKF